MAAKRKPFNPFYVLVVLVGTAFCISACAYGVTAASAITPRHGNARPEKSSLLAFMDEHGTRLMVGELLALAVCTVGAISTDGYWQRRATEQARSAADEEANTFPKDDER